MTPFITYELKVAVALAVFYMFYRLLLRKETFHRLNRAVLVGSALISFILPFCIITIKRPAPEISEPILMTPEIITGQLSSEGPVTGSVSWWPLVISALFWIGALFVLARIIISILSIRKVIRKSEKVEEGDGYTLYLSDRDIDPFSWMKSIVMSRKDYQSEHSSIMAHEKAHIASGHSMELLLVDIMTVFQWFNPAVWMLRSDLQEIHEYEADNAVLKEGAPLKDYQYLLIRKAVSKSGYSVANSFNHSILKNRITMMSKSKSSLARGLRVLYIVPLVCLGLGLQARTVFVPTDKDSEKTVTQDGSKGILPEVVVSKYGIKDLDPTKVINTDDQFKATQITVDPVWNQLDTPPECSENFSQWLTMRIQYPGDCLYTGTAMIQFTVDKNGKISDINLLKGVCEELDKHLVSLVEKSPSWTPAKKGGQSVAVKCVQPVIFRIAGLSQSASASTPTSLKNVSIEIGRDSRGDVTMTGEGKPLSLDGVKSFIASQGDPTSLNIRIKAASDIPMGFVNDLKDELAKAGSLRITYSSPSQGEEVRRYMPPVAEEQTNGRDSKYPQELLPGIDRERIMIARINSLGKYLIGSTPTQDDKRILELCRSHLSKNGRSSIFVLQCDRGTSYEAYQHLQTLMYQAYTDERNEKALADYGKPFASLSEEEKSAVQQALPVIIMETGK